MEKEHIDRSRDTGREVWESVRLQMAEGSGFLSAAWRSFHRFLRRHMLYFFIAGLLGGAAGAGIWYVKPATYEAEMTVSYVHYEKKIYADMLTKLNALVRAGNVERLAQQLGLPMASAKEIRSVEAYNIRKEDLAADLGTEKVPFYIAVQVKRPGILPELETALVDYLNGTKYVQERLEFMGRQLRAEQEFLQDRLKVVDSLSRILNSREDMSSEEKAVTRMELLEETLAVYDRIKNVKISLAFNKNVEILDGFVPVERPSGRGMSHFILFGFLAGLAFWFLVIIFR